jgi:hypothetical protein
MPALGLEDSRRAAHLRETECVAGHVGLETQICRDKISL